MNFQQRITRLQHSLSQHQIDALLVSDPVNIYYLTNFRSLDFHEPIGYLLILPQACHLFTSPGLAGEVQTQEGAQVHYVTQQTGGLKVALSPYVKNLRLGIESNHLTHETFDKLSHLLELTTLIPTSQLISKFRIKKDDQELEYIKAAQRITDLTFIQLIQLIKPGLTELHIQQQLLTILTNLGSHEPAFTPIVASGPNAATLHGRATTKLLQSGECLLLDFGASINGYKSDMTRTVFLSKAPTEFINHYEFVLQALYSVTAHIQPLIKASQLHQVIVDHYKTQIQFMPHTTGHGIGIQAHESPHLYTGCDEPLPTGAVITIEPGLYFPNKYGIRIEDMGYLDTQQFNLLTTSTHDLLQLT